MRYGTEPRLEGAPQWRIGRRRGSSWVHHIGYPGPAICRIGIASVENLSESCGRDRHAAAIKVGPVFGNVRDRMGSRADPTSARANRGVAVMSLCSEHRTLNVLV